MKKLLIILGIAIMFISCKKDKNENNLSDAWVRVQYVESIHVINGDLDTLVERQTTGSSLGGSIYFNFQLDKSRDITCIINRRSYFFEGKTLVDGIETYYNIEMSNSVAVHLSTLTLKNTNFGY